jgi:putative ABC transport system ATP-binding protein
VDLARRRPGGRRLGPPVAPGGPALSTSAVYALRDVQKTFSAGGTTFTLDIPQLKIARGAKLAFIGESGLGKSTLLELLAMILKPNGGRQFSFRPQPDEPAHDVAAIWQGRGADRLGRLRSRHIGYVLQHGGLLPYLSVRRNIELPCELLGLPREGVAERLAGRLGIAQQLDKRPAELSVGQRQRVAVARALAHAPAIVIADEPTAAVDTLNAERIVTLLVELAGELGVTLILASHAQELMRNAGFTLIEHRMSAADERSMTVTVSYA